MDVAYSKRSLMKIKVRSIVYSLYDKIRRVIKKIKRINHSDVVKKILIYPVFKYESEFSDILNRVLWGFPYKKELEISIMLEDLSISKNINSIETPKLQRRYLDENKSHIKFIKKGVSFLKFDKIIVWDKNFAASPILFPHLDKVEIADKGFFSISECNVWKKIYFTAFSKMEKEYYQNNSKKNFEKLYNKTINKKKGYCFLTGPSFDEYKKHNYAESIKVICNSIVINNEFLEFINGPDIIAFADPVFHFSSCEYAAIFRDYVSKVVEKYNCYVVVPEDTVPLLLTHYPSLRDSLIGVGLSENINLPTIDNLYVRGSGSIVSYLMTPLISSLCNEIYFLGADGREKSENYFWKHNKSVQLSDKMESVFHTHPSFFRDRIYEDWYDEHCEYFEELLKYGEKLNKKYFSLTRSFIPALAKRQLFQ